MNDDTSRTFRPSNISRTAVWVAAARAIGAREPDPTVRNPDDLAAALLGEPSALHVVHPVVTALTLPYEQAMEDAETAGLVRAMIVRTRFIDAALERAVNAGATQVLILGAGLDSHAYRCREMLSETRVFELDRPKTLDYKQRRVAEALGGTPDNLRYVALDLQDSVPDALARQGYDASRRTFILMEGVSMYLPEATVRSTLQFVAAHPHGSSVVLDFATRAMVDGIQRVDLARIPESARAATERFLDMIREEPWVFGLPLDEERSFLASTGLELGDLVTIGDEESVKRYLTRQDGTEVGGTTLAQAEAMRKASLDRMLEHSTPAQRAMMEQNIKAQLRQMAYRIAEAFATRH